MILRVWPVIGQHCFNWGRLKVLAINTSQLLKVKAKILLNEKLQRKAPRLVLTLTLVNNRRLRRSILPTTSMNNISPEKES